MKPQYSMVIQWTAEDDCCVVSIPELEPYFVQPCTHGETYEEAAKQGSDVIESMIFWLQEDDVPLPSAIGFSADDSTTENQTAELSR